MIFKILRHYKFEFLLLHFQTVLTLFEQCNHQIDLIAGQKIYISSPYYPAEYPIGTSCRYSVNAPLDYELNFKCNVNLNVQSAATRCQSEVFYFNSEGSEVLTASEYVCGSSTFERKSFLNRAVISYISQSYLERTLPVNLKSSVGENDENTGTRTTQETTTTASATEAFDLDIEVNDNFTNAFVYLTELLTSNVSQQISDMEVEQTLTASSTVPVENDANDSLPVSVWRKQSKLERIVDNGNGNSITSSPFNFGYVNNRGGGRFTCLVEVFKPPCDCGWSVSLKIAGPTGVAGVNEFPSMAGVKTKRFNQIFCGASIIHHRYLLSAAHCFTSAETNRSDLINVIVGENDVSTVFETLYTRTYDIEGIILHENFYVTAKSLRNDIALLRTRLAIEWSRSVGPACLPLTAFNIPSSDIPRKPPLPGQHLETAGWGTTAFGGAQPTQLLKTTLDVHPSDQCRRTLRSLPPGVFCTYTPGRDTCQYDSGSALYLRTERLFAVGIVSYGFACAAQQPSVNTRIASFIKWIKSKTPEISYCVR